MSLAIHKIVSKKRCQSYFISRRSPHHGISKDSDLCASAHCCLHYAYARLIARVNSQFTILLVHTDNAGDFPHDGHSLHDTDGVIKMSLFYEIGDDHDLGNAIVAALLYHLGDADIVVAKDSCDICQGSGTILHL